MVLVQESGLAQGISGLGNILGPILKEAAKQKQKQNTLNKLLSVMGGSQSPQEAGSEGISGEGIFKPRSAEELIIAESIMPGAGAIYQKAEKERKAQFEEKKEKGRLQNAFNRSVDILKSGTTGYTPKGFTPQGRRLRSELNTLSEVFAARFVKELNKGNLPQSRFNYLMGLIPKERDTDQAIKGKLKALGEIFDLDLGKLEKKAVKKEQQAQQALKKVEKGTKISEEIVDDLIKRSGGDWKKAQELAKKLGYEVE